jgi:hypothetical protein
MSLSNHEYQGMDTKIDQVFDEFSPLGFNGFPMSRLPIDKLSAFATDVYMDKTEEEVRSLKVAIAETMAAEMPTLTYYDTLEVSGVGLFYFDTESGGMPTKILNRGSVLLGRFAGFDVMNAMNYDQIIAKGYGKIPKQMTPSFCITDAQFFSPTTGAHAYTGKKILLPLNSSLLTVSKLIVPDHQS